MIRAYKLVRKRRDGSLGPLFIDRATVLPIGFWLASRAVLTPGFQYRPGWHACSKKSAPHLSKKGRVWVRVKLWGVAKHQRPKSQGGLWYTSHLMKIEKVLRRGEY